MSTVVSRDGTSIDYTSEGSGPAVVLVGGALDDGAENAPLASALAGSFTVFNYARRGRGASGDTLPYHPDREFEDLVAILDIAGDAHLFGASSGGALVLEAVSAGVPAQRIAIYDPPYSLDADSLARWRRYVAELHAALESNDAGRAIELFMDVAGLPPEAIEGVKASPYWAPLLPLAHTLRYDAACLNNGLPPVERLSRIRNPVVVISRSTSAPPDPEVVFFQQAADATASALPNATRIDVAAPGHAVDADALAPVLLGAFSS